MKKLVIILGAVVALTAGCTTLSSSSPSASPETAPGLDVDTNFGGTAPSTDVNCPGVWHPSTGVCSRAGGA